MQRTRAGRAKNSLSRVLLLGVAAFLGLTGLVGCSAGVVSSPGSSASSPSPSATAAVVVPLDGISLAALGLTHGPTDRVFLPQDVLVSARVDQANNVTLVLTSPPAGTLAAYLRRTLPTNGFVLTADEPSGDTLTFTGLGWTGTFTGDVRASALLLRPAS